MKEKAEGPDYSVHVGSWGGMPMKILAFVAALLGGILPLTGYYMWLRRMVKRSRARRE